MNPPELEQWDCPHCHIAFDRFPPYRADGFPIVVHEDRCPGFDPVLHRFTTTTDNEWPKPFSDLLATAHQTPGLRIRLIRAARSFRGRVNKVRFAYQRVVRGWDDTALWSLDHHLTKTLGAQLLDMAETTPGYPSDEGWTYERWISELRQHGQALAAYGAADTLEYDTVYPPAREALQWVTENLGALWT